MITDENLENPMLLPLSTTNVNIDRFLVQVQGQSSHYIIMSFIILCNLCRALYHSIIL
jgi:hypothetical protein